jgi:hypothetical protein
MCRLTNKYTITLEPLQGSSTTSLCLEDCSTNQLYNVCLPSSIPLSRLLQIADLYIKTLEESKNLVPQDPELGF